MIANTLIFLLGMLVMAFVAMVLAPVFWRKAQSFARRDFEATIPISANEIRAEFDRVRAEAAVSVRRQEVLSAETREKAARAEADRGRSIVEATETRTENRRLTGIIAEQEAALEGLRAVLADREADLRTLSGDLAESREAGERMAREFEALGEDHRDLVRLSEQQAIEITTSKTRIERLVARLEPAAAADVADAPIERLAAEIAGLQQSLQQERAAAKQREADHAAVAARLASAEQALAAGPSPKPKTAGTSDEPHRSVSSRFEAALGRRELPALDPAREADIRDRIADVAARVIRMTALAEGPDSPLSPLLEQSGSSGDGTRPGQTTTLADRVRLLAEAERKSVS